MKTLVLLSGGLDSVGALLWALAHSADAEALFCAYGQPAARNEKASAFRTCSELLVPLHTCDLGAVYAGTKEGLFSTRDSARAVNRDTAFVPCRNPLLISAAAATALSRWPGQRTRIVVGFNSHDSAGFPDCSARFVEAMGEVLNVGMGADLLRIDAPWIDSTKLQIVQWVKENCPHHMRLIKESWSCYRADGPCGACTACVVRGAVA